MAGASFLGAPADSRAAMRLGSSIIRPLPVLVSSLVACRVLLDPENPWRETAQEALLALF